MEVNGSSVNTNNQSSPLQSPSSFQSQTSLIKILLYTIGAVLLVGVGAFGYSIYQTKFQKKELSNTTTFNTTATPTANVEQSNSSVPTLTTGKNEELLTANAHTGIDDERSPYFTFQLKYPSKYLVTSDDMVTDYKTQGGMAPPRLIFTLGNQPLGKLTYWDLQKKEEDCILVWSTSGFRTIDDWHNLIYQKNPKVISQDSFTRDKYTINKYMAYSFILDKESALHIAQHLEVISW